MLDVVKGFIFGMSVAALALVVGTAPIWLLYWLAVHG